MKLKRDISNYDTALQPAISSATVSRDFQCRPASNNENLRQQILEAARERTSVKPLPEVAFITNDFSVAVRMLALKGPGTNIPEEMAISKLNKESISRIIETNIATFNYPGLCKREIVGLNSSINVKEIQF